MTALPRHRVATTRWSVVLAAGGGSAPARERALEELCAAYWYPLYAWLRRSGHGEHEACDLTQGFFAELLEKNVVGAADPERGRFRAFLFAALGNYVSRAARHERAEKRGGKVQLLSIDAATAEARYALEPVHLETPERVFERRWALTLLEQALAGLRQDYAARGQERLFLRLRPALTGALTTPYAALAEELGLSEGSLKVCVHRLRKRFREKLSAAVAHTVSEPGDLEGELRHLVSAVSL